jgi:hypothetical protein
VNDVDGDDVIAIVCSGVGWFSDVKMMMRIVMVRDDGDGVVMVWR